MNVLLVYGYRKDEGLKELIEAFRMLGHKTKVVRLTEYDLKSHEYDDTEIIFEYAIRTPRQRARFSKITRVLSIAPANLQWCLKNLNALLNLETSSQNRSIQYLKRIASYN